MFKYTVLNNSGSHFFAIAGAMFLHIILAAFVLSSSKPMVISDQFIEVNLARPSKQALQKESAAIKLENNFIVASKTGNISKNQTANKKPLENKLAEIEKDKKLDQAKAIENTAVTTGKISKDAIADNGAYTKPVFDAPSLQNGAPSYPEYARRNGMQGKVMLEVHVNKEGSASAVLVVNSSGYGVLDKAAYEAVKNWHFIPAKIDGKAVETPMPVLVPVIFSFS
jgi:TonB family protein